MIKISVIPQFALKDTSEEVKMRSRAWCYTLNNYTEEERDAARQLACEYHIFGYERGEEGTPHLQGYIHYSTLKSLTQMKKVMPRAHWEPRRGTVDQAVEYCKKEGDFEEFGNKPMSQKEKGESEKNRWKRVLEAAQSGDTKWIEENEPRLWCLHEEKLKAKKKLKTEVLDYVDTPHEWWCGPTGTGKSRALWELYPGHYQKEKNKWWCNYTGQDTVAIEEADPKTMEHLADRLKVWADRYPFPGEIKGGRLEGIRPKKIIVTSNYSIEECFPNPSDYEPMKRRFRVVRFGEEPAVSPLFNL